MMLHWFRARARLALVAVVGLLAGSLVLGLPSVADAATVGNSQPYAVDLTSWEGGWKCAGNARWSQPTGGAPGIDYSTKCTLTGVDTTFGPADSGSWMQQRFTGQDANGDNCTLSGPVDSISGFSPSVTGRAGFLLWIDGMTCSVTQVCVHIKHVRNNYPDDTYDQCVDFSLGMAPASATPPSTCPAGHPYQVQGVWNPSTNQQDLKIWYDSSIATGVRSWTVNVWQDWGGTDNWHLATFGGSPGFEQSVTPGSNVLVVAGLNGYGVAGVEISLNGSPPADLAGTGIVNQRAPGSTWATDYNAPTAAKNYGGITDSGSCRFYIGKKHAEIADTTADEPWGSVLGDPSSTVPTPTAPTANTDSGCGFSISTPSTWATAGMCQVATLIGQMIGVMKSILGVLGDVVTGVGRVVSAIGKIAAPIVSAIAGLVTSMVSQLVTLFTPHVSAWNWSGLVDEVKARPPTSIVLAIGAGLAAAVDGYSTAGSCGVLGDFFPDHPMTCAQVTSIAGFGAAYDVVAGLLLIGTGYTAFLMVRSATRQGGD